MAEKIKYTRKDLKGPDEFISTLSRAVNWIKENRTIALGAVGGLLFVALAAFGTRAYLQWEENKAAANLWPHLNRAREILRGGGPADLEKLARIEQFLTIHVGSFPKSRAAVYARYYLGNIAFTSGKYDLAASHFAAAARAWKDKGMMEYLILQGLAQSLEAKGDLANAADVYRKAAEAADGELRDESRLGQARVLATLGKFQDASAVYRSILTDNPESPLKGFVELRIAQLG